MVSLLLDGQRVHVCPEGDGGTVSGSDLRHDPGDSDAAARLQSQSLEPVPDDAGGALLAEAEFGVAV
jgi:hypothetical protein